MIEAPPGINLWDPGWRPDAIVITTNGTVNSSGRAVMGRGCALEAKQRVEDIDLTFGRLLRKHGSRVVVIIPMYNYRPVHIGTCAIVSFPVKRHWREDADLELIERSVGELLELSEEYGWRTVVMPRPGCGAGKLSWDTVRPLLANQLDDRFTVVSL